MGSDVEGFVESGADDSDNEGTTSEVGTEQDEIVPLSEVGDEDLDAYLQAALDEEEHQVPNSSPTKDNKPSADPVATKTPDAEQDPNAPLTRAEFNALLERLNKQEKKVDGQELLIQRRTSELGEAKKQLKHIAQTLNEKFQEAIENNSQADALDIRDALKETEQKIGEVEQEESTLTRKFTAQKLVSTYVPEDQFDVEGMAEALARDGVPPQFVERFKADPLGFVSDGDSSPGLTMVHLAKRAYAEGMLKKLYPIAKSLADEVKKLKGTQGDVLKKVQQVAKQTPQISAAGARPNKQQRATTIDAKAIAQLSDEELDEFLANNN